KVHLVDGTKPEEVKAAITDKTKAVFAETITNPSLNVTDIETISDIAHAAHIPLIVDNTFATKFAKPLKWGADIVIISATNWIGGTVTSNCDFVVDRGCYDWAQLKFADFI